MEIIYLGVFIYFYLWCVVFDAGAHDVGVDEACCCDVYKIVCVAYSQEFERARQAVRTFQEDARNLALARHLSVRRVTHVFVFKFTHTHAQKETKTRISSRSCAARLCKCFH